MISNAIDTALITAIRLDGKGGGKEISREELIRDWKHDSANLWMHLDFSFDDVNYYLSELAGLGPALINALLEESIRPRVARFPGGMMTTLRGVNMTPGASPDDLISLRVWLSNNRLITLRKHPLHAIQEVRSSFDTGTGATDLTGVMAELADHMVDQMGELLAELDQSISTYEERLINDMDVHTSEVARLRRPMITLSRFIEPQYDCLARLCEPSMGLTETHCLTIREVANHLYRYLEDLRAMQERALVLQEQIWSIHSERLNSRMYLLSFITVLFLPLTFLTGLLGINVGGIPGNTNPDGFFWVIVLCAIISILLLAGIVFLQRRHRRRER